MKVKLIGYFSAYVEINYAVAIYLVYQVLNLYYNSNFCFSSKIKEHFMITLVERRKVMM